MEIDFLGLKPKNTPEKGKEGWGGVYKHSGAGMQWPCSFKLLSPPQFLYSEASKGDHSFIPSQNGCHFKPLFLAKNNSTSLFNSTSSRTSPNLSEKIAITDNNLVIATAECRRSKRALVAKPLLNNSSPVNLSACVLNNNNNSSNLRNTASLTLFYYGTLHVFHDIPPEKAEAIMRVAGTNPMTTEAKEILAQLIEETNGKSMKNYIQKSCLYGGGGLAMARKATLARFLVKRMHRLSHARPYSLNAGSPESCTSQVKEIGQPL